MHRPILQECDEDESVNSALLMVDVLTKFLKSLSLPRIDSKQTHSCRLAAQVRHVFRKKRFFLRWYYAYGFRRRLRRREEMGWVLEYPSLVSPEQAEDYFNGAGRGGRTGRGDGSGGSSSPGCSSSTTAATVRLQHHPSPANSNCGGGLRCRSVSPVGSVPSTAATSTLHADVAAVEGTSNSRSRAVSPLVLSLGDQDQARFGESRRLEQEFRKPSRPLAAVLASEGIGVGHRQSFEQDLSFVDSLLGDMMLCQ